MWNAMKNKLFEPLFILLFSILILSFLSYLPFKIGKYKLPDFLSDLKPLNTKSSQNSEQLSNNQQKDTSLLESKKILTDTNISGFGDLTMFFEAMYNQQQKPEAIHIAYFGDSMIEGDLITMDLRSLMQRKFGGNGVGFMPVTSVTAGFRTTINHQFNDLWSTYNFIKRPPQKNKLGWSGFTFVGKEGASVNFAKARGCSAFKNVKLYFKNTLECSYKINTGEKSNIIRIAAADSIQTLDIHDNIEFDNLKIEVLSGEPEIFGFNFENGSGVYVDNYSFRGTSGIPLADIDQEMFSFTAKRMNCKMVILHYGLNVVGHDAGDYSWYLKPFQKTIKKIKDAFPNATIVIASVGDKSYKNGQQHQTEPDIPLFVGMQAKLAKEENVVFWNMYRAMGGYNSMKRWVEESPKRAAKDYTHLNHEGAKEVATLFYNWLMDEYNIYLKKKISSIVKLQSTLNIEIVK